MRNNQLSRKRRQFRYASKKVTRWVESGRWSQLSVETRQKWINKLRRLARNLRGYLTPREWKKALAGLAMVMGLQAPVLAQQYATPLDNPFDYVFGVMTAYNQPAFTDIDADGDLDVFVGTGYGELYFFENTGDSSEMILKTPIANPFGFSLASGQYYVAPTFGDLDGDGDQDMIVGTDNSDLYYVENTGTPNAPIFGVGVANANGLNALTSLYQSPTLADMDGDTDLDLLVGTFAGDFIYQENTGTPMMPAFGTPQVNPFGLSNQGSYSTPAVADFDMDGDLDLMVAVNTGTYYYFQDTSSTSTPAFDAAQLNPFNLSTVGYDAKLAAADLDDDGDTDLLSGIYYGSVFWENTGTPIAPAFGTPVENAFGLRRQQYFGFPAQVDIDGDGDLDLFVGEYLGNIAFHENIGTATDARLVYRGENPFGITIPYNYLSAVTFADFDGDGDQDMLVGKYGYAANLDYYENIGRADSAAFAPAVTNPFGITPTYYYAFPALADIDNDGDFDLMVGSYGTFEYFENTGTATMPTFGAVQSNPFGLAPTTYYFVAATIADVDGDSDLDILAGNYNGDLAFYENIGRCDSAAFAAEQLNPFGLTSGYSLIFPTMADFDHDGDQDVLDVVYYGQTRFFENTDPNAGFDQVDSVNICDGQTFVFNGDTLSQAGVYSQVFAGVDGCDSTVALVLNVDSAITTFNSAAICAGDTLTFGNQQLTATGTYNLTFKLTGGCDSTSVLDLVVNPAFQDTVEATICDGESFPFAGTTFSQPGFYTQFMQTVAGCDSNMVLNLRVDPAVDATVNQMQEVLTANATNATYQWLDCDQNFAPIMGETNATFTATANGNYAVQVTDQGTDCMDTSACVAVTNISNDLALAGISVQPTWVKQELTIDLGYQRTSIKLALIDGQGRVIRQEDHIQAQKIVWDMQDLTAGVYWIRIEAGEAPLSVKIVKL